MAAALETPSVFSNYRFDLTARTWERVRDLRSGTAVFTMPSGPIKCAGAPQKIAYLAADYWRQQGVLDQIRVVLVLPTRGTRGGHREVDAAGRVGGRLRRSRGVAGRQVDLGGGTPAGAFPGLRRLRLEDSAIFPRSVRRPGR
ncbi:hypothetical protein V3N99_22055 [Dermatophilaceae bacterium Soc4.6]